MILDVHYILNVNDGKDTIHDPRHLTESCNTDQIVGRKAVDAYTAAALIDKGQAVRCGHCNQQEESE